MSDEEFIEKYKTKAQEIYRILKGMTPRDARMLLKWVKNCIDTASFVDLDRVMAEKQEKKTEETIDRSKEKDDKPR